MKNTPKLPDGLLYQSYSDNLFDTMVYNLFVVTYHVGNSCRIAGRFYSLDAAKRFINECSGNHPRVQYHLVRYSLQSELLYRTPNFL